MIIFAQGCVKKDDVLPPNVIYELPFENSIFVVPDTIHVRAQIDSDELIESVDVRIVDLNYVPSSESISNSINAMSYELNEFLIIDDIYLESGDYFVEIIARSANETKRKYQTISIIEFPREYKKLIVVQENGEIQSVNGLSDTLALDAVSGFGADGPDLAIINNFHQQIIVGYSNGAITSYSAENGSILWEAAQSNPIWSEYYQDIFVDEEDRNVYLSTSEGQILAFDQFGNNTNLIEVGDNNKAGQFFIDGDLIIAEVENYTGLERWIKVYSKHTGSLIGTAASISMDVKNILRIGEGEYLIAGDGNGDEQFLVYFRDDPGFFIPGAFDIGNVYDIDMAENGDVAVAHSTGIYMYQPDSNTLFNIQGFTDVTDIEYDDTNSVLIMASNQLIRYYSFQTGTVVNEISVSGTIKTIDILYNK